MRDLSWRDQQLLAHFQFPTTRLLAIVDGLGTVLENRGRTTNIDGTRSYFKPLEQGVYNPGLYV